MCSSSIIAGPDRCAHVLAPRAPSGTKKTAQRSGHVEN